MNVLLVHTVEAWECSHPWPAHTRVYIPSLFTSTLNISSYCTQTQFNNVFINIHTWQTHSIYIPDQYIQKDRLFGNS